MMAMSLVELVPGLMLVIIQLDNETGKNWFREGSVITTSIHGKARLPQSRMVSRNRHNQSFVRP